MNLTALDSTSSRCPRSPGRAGRLALLLACAAVTACGLEPFDAEESEPTAQGVTTTFTSRESEIDVGFGIKRPMYIEFGTKCVAWGYKVLHKGSPPERYCTRSELDDTVWKTTKIFKDVEGRNNDAVFPAARSCGTRCVDWETKESPKGYGPRVKYCVRTAPSCVAQLYRGCGPAAAANVLNFYGVELSTTDIADSYIPTFGFPFSSNVGTMPDKLAAGLQRLLNEKADGIFTVRRKSYADIRSEVQNAVKKGQPIILLVNNGGHYVTVTGFADYSRLSVTDYVGSERTVDDLDLETGNITGDLVGLAGSYLPYTVITIERRPR